MLRRVLENVYESPAADRLERAVDGRLFGEVRITRLEITTATTDEGAFVALLDARFRSALADMAAAMVAPTFPVHDPPHVQITMEML